MNLIVNGNLVKVDIENENDLLNMVNLPKRKGSSDQSYQFSNTAKYRINGAELIYGEKSGIKVNLVYGDESYIEMNEGNVTLHGFNLELANS